MVNSAAPARFPILTFAGIGLLLFLINDALISIVMRDATKPGQPQTVALIHVTNLLAPGLYLLAVALGLFLTAGSVSPPWLRKLWPLAITAFYALHIPMNFLPPLAILGRWGFLVYVFVGSLGVVCALRLLTGHLHVAALFLVLNSVVSPLLRSRLPIALRSPATAVFSIITFALIGWWFRDAAKAKRPAES